MTKASKLAGKGWSPSLMEHTPAHQGLIDLGNMLHQETKSYDTWYANVNINIPWFDKHKDQILGGVDKLPKHSKQVAICVGNGESLKKAIDMFQEVKDDDRFVISCSNSSLRYLLEHDIVPSYVCAIDGMEFDNTEMFKDLPEKAKDVILLGSASACHGFFKYWPGKIIVIPYVLPDRNIRRKLKRRYGDSPPSGGNSINAMTSLFVNFTEIRTYLFVGNNLSFSKNFYHDHTPDYHSANHFFLPNIYGEEVKTDFAMYTYKVWLESAIKQLPRGFRFINCSEGVLGVKEDGSLYNFLDHMPLDIAIQTIKKAWKFQDRPWDEKNKIEYDIAWNTYGYRPILSSTFWPRIIDDKLPDFKKALDIGCGQGFGIKCMRDKGLDVSGIDVANITELWEKNGVVEYCKVAPAHDIPYDDDTFDLVVCSEVLEHIPIEGIENSLKEIYRIGSDKFFVTIGLDEEAFPNTAIKSHVTVKEADWWIKQFENADFKIMYCCEGRIPLTRQEDGTISGFNERDMLVYAVKDDTPYKNGEKLLVRDKKRPLYGLGNCWWLFEQNDIKWYRIHGKHA